MGRLCSWGKVISACRVGDWNLWAFALYHCGLMSSCAFVLGDSVLGAFVRIPDFSAPTYIDPQRIAKWWWTCREKFKKKLFFAYYLVMFGIPVHNKMPCYRGEDRAMRPIYRLFHPNYFVHAYIHYFARIWFWTNLSRSHSAHWSRMIGCWF